MSSQWKRYYPKATVFARNYIPGEPTDKIETPDDFDYNSNEYMICVDRETGISFSLDFSEFNEMFYSEIDGATRMFSVSEYNPSVDILSDTIVAPEHEHLIASASLGYIVVTHDGSKHLVDESGLYRLIGTSMRFGYRESDSKQKSLFSKSSS